MTRINFKKLVLRKNLPLIQNIIEATDPQASVHSCEGISLLGGTQKGAHRHDIELAGQLLGWVQGNEKASAIAILLTRLACTEQEKRSLSTELLGKYKEISLLFDLSEKILGCLTVREAAEVVLQEAQLLLNAQSGALLLQAENRNFLEKVATLGHNSLFDATILWGEGVIGTIVQSGRGKIVNNVLCDLQPNSQPDSGAEPSERSASSLICVPLKNKTSILGAIALTRPASEPYAAQDLKLTTTLAGQAAGVINALLHEEKLKESRQNDLILRLSSQIRESLELDKILATTVREIYAALQLDRCLFLWSESDTKDSLTGAGLNIGLNVVTECKRSDLPSSKGCYAPDAVNPLVRLLGEGRPLRINDIAQISDVTIRDFLASQNFTAFLAIPIQTRLGQMGVICCGNSQEPRAWSDGEVSLLQAVTNQLAIALDQAELYQQSLTTAQTAQDKAQQLEATVAQLQQAQLQLVQSEKMSSIGQMVAGVAHEINNPVCFIHGNLKHLQRYIEDLLDLIAHYQAEHSAPSRALQAEIKAIDLDFLIEDLPKTLTSMKVGTDRIREIVLSLRNFSRLDQADFKSADLHEGIDSTLLILGHRLKGTDSYPRIKIIQTYGDLPPVDCYPGQLNQVFMNIVVNSIDALEKASVSAPTIAICTQQIDANRVQIRIADNGPGIPISIQDKLFDPFFTTKEIGKGTGLGLSISYQIITERHGGTLVVQSAPGQGTEFVIEIPIQQRDRPDRLSANL